MAHDGYGRTMRPAHSMVDGDTIFAMATGEVKVDLNVAGMLAARVVEQAIVSAVTNAWSFQGIKAPLESIIIPTLFRLHGGGPTRPLSPVLILAHEQRQELFIANFPRVSSADNGGLRGSVHHAA